MSFLIFGPIFFLLFGTNLAPAEEKYLTIAYAANFQFVANELNVTFEKQTPIKTKSVFASSGKLSNQILNGAPFDLFLSADQEYPQKIEQKGFSASPSRIFAYGSLVLWTLFPLNLTPDLDFLQKAEIKKIALANPDNAPYGLAARKILQEQKILAKIEKKLIFGENIAQVNNYIYLKTVDLGFTAKSVVMSPEMQGKGKWLEISCAKCQPIPHSVVLLKYGQKNNREAANKFYNFLFSEPARKILKKYGYQIKE